PLRKTIPLTTDTTPPSQYAYSSNTTPQDRDLYLQLSAPVPFHHPSSPLSSPLTPEVRPPGQSHIPATLATPASPVQSSKFDVRKVRCSMSRPKSAPGRLTILNPPFSILVCGPTALRVRISSFTSLASVGIRLSAIVYFSPFSIRSPSAVSLHP